VKPTVVDLERLPFWLSFIAGKECEADETPHDQISFLGRIKPGLAACAYKRAIECARIQGRADLTVTSRVHFHGSSEDRGMEKDEFFLRVAQALSGCP
jgi:hypothetical protein